MGNSSEVPWFAKIMDDLIMQSCYTLHLYLKKSFQHVPDSPFLFATCLKFCFNFCTLLDGSMTKPSREVRDREKQ